MQPQDTQEDFSFNPREDPFFRTGIIRACRPWHHLGDDASDTEEKSFRDLIFDLAGLSSEAEVSDEEAWRLAQIEYVVLPIFVDVDQSGVVQLSTGKVEDSRHRERCGILYQKIEDIQEFAPADEGVDTEEKVRGWILRRLEKEVQKFNQHLETRV